jgi:hypothetical protein
MNGLTRSKNLLARSGLTERLEMATLNGRQIREQDASDDDDDNESIGGDEGERALLGLERKPSYTQVQGDLEESTWRFVRGILVEVGEMRFSSRLGRLTPFERQLRHCY